MVPNDTWILLTQTHDLKATLSIELSCIVVGLSFQASETFRGGEVLNEAPAQTLPSIRRCDCYVHQNRGRLACPFEPYDPDYLAAVCQRQKSP